MSFSKAKPGGISSFLPHFAAFPREPNSHGALLAWGPPTNHLTVSSLSFCSSPSYLPAALPYPFPLVWAPDSFPSSILICFPTVFHQISPRSPLPIGPPGRAQLEKLPSPYCLCTAAARWKWPTRTAHLRPPLSPVPSRYHESCQNTAHTHRSFCCSPHRHLPWSSLRFCPGRKHRDCFFSASSQPKGRAAQSLPSCPGGKPRHQPTASPGCVRRGFTSKLTPSWRQMASGTVP